MKNFLKVGFVAALILSFSVASVYSDETFSGRNNPFEDSGIDLDLSITQIYQNNVKGGLSTHNRRGRYSGRYDLELTFDGQKLLGVENSQVYMHNRGSWTDTAGINAVSVGSVYGVNGNAFGDRAIDVVELWYQHGFADDTFQLRIGKLDLTGGFECRGCPVSFDGSSYANSEISQFMNSALVNNPTIPFPDNGLGVVGHYNPDDRWYISAAIADAQGDFRETGFNTAFHGEDYFFSILETGIVTEMDSANGPLQGAYRVGFWYDPQPKGNSDSSENYRDDAGFYLTFDQKLFRENSVDDQGLGAFFRYGHAPSKANDITNFVSLGFQYEGLFEGRDSDVLGFGFAKGVFSNSADTTYTENSEAVYEIYYNAEITPSIRVAPSVQYVVHPGGVEAVGDATVLGVRLEMIL